MSKKNSSNYAKIEKVKLVIFLINYFPIYAKYIQLKVMNKYSIIMTLKLAKRK